MSSIFSFESTLINKAYSLLSQRTSEDKLISAKTAKEEMTDAYEESWKTGCWSCLSCLSSWFIDKFRRRVQSAVQMALFAQKGFELTPNNAKRILHITGEKPTASKMAYIWKLHSEKLKKTYQCIRRSVNSMLSLIKTIKTNEIYYAKLKQNMKDTDIFLLHQIVLEHLTEKDPIFLQKLEHEQIGDAGTAISKALEKFQEVFGDLSNDENKQKYGTICAYLENKNQFTAEKQKEIEKEIYRFNERINTTFRRFTNPELYYLLLPVKMRECLEKRRQEIYAISRDLAKQSFEPLLINPGDDLLNQNVKIQSKELNNPNSNKFITVQAENQQNEKHLKLFYNLEYFRHEDYVFTIGDKPQQAIPSEENRQNIIGDLRTLSGQDQKLLIILETMATQTPANFGERSFRTKWSKEGLETDLFNPQFKSNRLI